MGTDAHQHTWGEAMVTELDDIYLRCRCGEERLMTGTVVRMRRPKGDWETPYVWNRQFYRKDRPDGLDTRP